MAIKVIRELATRFSAQVDGASIKRAEGAIARFAASGRNMVAAFAGTAAVVGIRTFVKETVAMGDQLDKLRLKTGLAAGSIQELQFAADRQGVSFGNLTMSLVAFQRRLAVAARNAGGEMAVAFRQLGIDARDGVNDIEGSFFRLANAIEGIQNPAERIRLLDIIMGEAGREMTKLLGLGAAGVRELMDEARRLGFVLDDSVIDVSAKLTDEQARQNAVWRGFRNNIAKFLLPAVLRLNESLVQLSSTGRNEFVESFGSALAGAVDAARGGMVSLAEVLKGVKVGFDAMPKTIQNMAKALALVFGARAFAKRFPALAALLALQDVLFGVFEAITGREIIDTVTGDLLTAQTGAEVQKQAANRQRAAIKSAERIGREISAIDTTQQGAGLLIAPKILEAFRAFGGIRSTEDVAGVRDLSGFRRDAAPGVRQETTINIDARGSEPSATERAVRSAMKQSAMSQERAAAALTPLPAGAN